MIAVDKARKVHVAWYGFVRCASSPEGVASHIYYTNNVSGTFSRPVDIKLALSEENGWYSKYPFLAVDSKGSAHIAFTRSTSQTSVREMDDIYYVTNAPQASVHGSSASIPSFQKPVQIVEGSSYPNKPGEVQGPSTPYLHCDSRGRLHLTFQAMQFGTNRSSHILYMTKKGGAWKPPVTANQGGLHFRASFHDRHSRQRPHRARHH